jgi:integrase/recombinase XerD
VRRSLGYDLGTAERALRRFVQYADMQGARHVTTDLFLRCQTAFGNAGRSTWGARFVMVRLFSQWLHGLDATHEVLPRGLVPYRYCRTHPYIFTNAQIVAIVEEAAQLPSIYGMRGLTCSTLFGLIAVTGMRINEALSLDAGDVHVGRDRRRHRGACRRSTLYDRRGDHAPPQPGCRPTGRPAVLGGSRPAAAAGRL